MNRMDAAIIAVKYKKHAKLRKKCRKAGDKSSEKFHEGCMQMALQIFEEFCIDHGFGSPDQAIKKMVKVKK